MTALSGPVRSRSQDAPKPAPGPQAEGKTLFASVRRPAAEVIADAFAEADRRDPGRARPWLAVIDGNCHQIETVQTLAAEYQIKVPILIDLMHVTHNLWKAAGSFFHPANPEPANGSESRPPRSWPGSTATSAPGSAAAPPPSATAPPSAPAPTSAPATWKTSRTTWTTPFLKAGWPVASGLIEGEARWLIKDRMEVTGARWSLDGAEAVLNLRALAGNGDFDEYFGFHLRQQKQRDHASRPSPQPHNTRPECPTFNGAAPLNQ